MCYLNFEGIGLGLMYSMVQISSLMNATPSVDIARVGSWNSVSEVWVKFLHITQTTQVSEEDIIPLDINFCIQ